MDSPIVTFERNVVMVYCTMSEDGSPWRVTYNVVDNRQFVSLKGEMNHAMKRMAGISEHGNAWSRFLRVMIEARDQAVTQHIEARYADNDEVQPTSFHAAFLGANVPSTMQIAMPGFDDKHEMWVTTSSRKGTMISIELTEENLAHVFTNIKHYSINPEPINDNWLEDDYNDGDDIVKYRRNNGRWSYVVEWRDIYGAWRKRWASFKGEAMRQAAKQELTEFYEKNHIPAGDDREVAPDAASTPVKRSLAKDFASDTPRSHSECNDGMPEQTSSQSLVQQSTANGDASTPAERNDESSVDNGVKKVKTFHTVSQFWASFRKEGDKPSAAEGASE